jgi:acetyl-CoA carboxylase carboxyltransferase component
MNSRDLGADLAFAWPGAQLGVMGPRQAVGIIHRREIAAAPAPDAAHDQLAGAYAEEHLNAAAATREGFIDEVVAPSRTRERVAAALAALDVGGRAVQPTTNIPL